MRKKTSRIDALFGTISPELILMYYFYWTFYFLTESETAELIFSVKIKNILTLLNVAETVLYHTVLLPHASTVLTIENTILFFVMIEFLQDFFLSLLALVYKNWQN